MQHILQILLIFSSPEGYRLQISIPCIFCVYGMTLYWPTLQFYLSMYALFVCRNVAPPDECYYNTVLCCNYFSLLSVVSHAFSTLCVYSKFRNHPHPLGYLWAKFCVYCGASQWIKTAYSITQSLSLFVLWKYVRFLQQPSQVYVFKEHL